MAPGLMYLGQQRPTGARHSIGLHVMCLEALCKLPADGSPRHPHHLLADRPTTKDTKGYSLPLDSCYALPNAKTNCSSSVLATHQREEERREREGGEDPYTLTTFWFRHQKSPQWCTRERTNAKCLLVITSSFYT